MQKPAVFASCLAELSCRSCRNEALPKATSPEKTAIIAKSYVFGDARATVERQKTKTRYVYSPLDAPVQAKAKKARPNLQSPFHAVGCTSAWVALADAKWVSPVNARPLPPRKKSLRLDVDSRVNAGPTSLPQVPPSPPIHLNAELQRLSLSRPPPIGCSQKQWPG